MAERTGGVRGRPPKPTALKVLHGDFKHDPGRRNSKEPVITAQDVKAPATLSPAAREAWDYLHPILTRARLFTPADLHLLAEFCEAVTIVRLARIEIIKQATGQLVVAPGASSPYNSYSKAILVMTNLAGRLGLSPADRTRIQVDVPQSNPDDLISGAG